MGAVESSHVDLRDILNEDGSEKKEESVQQGFKSHAENMETIEQADMKKLLHTIAHLKIQVEEENEIVESIKSDCIALDGFEQHYQQENQAW